MFKSFMSWLGLPTKEEAYIADVEQSLKETISNEMRLLHERAIIEAQLAANAIKQQKITECLPQMRRSLEKRSALKTEPASKL